MNMQELQDRVNAIVQRVNDYEAGLQKEQGDETELLSEHKYCDIHCLRAVYDWITGCDSTRKTNTTLNSTVNGRLYSFDNYHRMDRQSEFQFTELFYNTNNLNSTGSYNIDDEKVQYSWASCRNNNGSDDICGLYNLKYLSGVFGTRLQQPPNSTISAWSSYSIGWNNVTCVNIADALVTESQVVNLMDTNIIQFHQSTNWQGSDNVLRNNLSCSNNYFGIYLFSNETNTSTGSPIGLNPDSTPSGRENRITSTIFGSNGDVSIGNNFQLKLFLPDASAIWAKPETSYGQKYCYYYSNESATRGFVSNSKPAQQTYFELAFKRRRAGCKAAGLDFIPTLDTVMDNDPQGLATRFALAQCKPYYRGRAWFEELNELYTENGEYQAKLADAILEASESMNDLEYLQNYKLDYETVANVMEWPL